MHTTDKSGAVARTKKVTCELLEEQRLIVDQAAAILDLPRWRYIVAAAVRDAEQVIADPERFRAPIAAETA